MPKIIKIKCQNCGKILGKKHNDNKYYILTRDGKRSAYTIVSVRHNNGGHIEFTCSECEEKNYFRNTEITKGLEYCVSPKKPIKK